MSSWSDRRVVITGLGVVSSLGSDPSTLWQRLVNGECGIDRIKGFDPTGFDCQIAAEVPNFDPTAAFPSPKELRRTDRFTQFAVFAGAEALKDSGVDLNVVDLNEFGVFIGSGIGGLRTTEDQHKVLLNKGPGRVSPFMIPMLILNMASGLFSLYYRLKGPNLAPAPHAPPPLTLWVKLGRSSNAAMPNSWLPAAPRPLWFPSVWLDLPP